MAFWARIGPAGSFGALLVGGCGARAVSRKTPIYFIIYQPRRVSPVLKMKYFQVPLIFLHFHWVLILNLSLIEYETTLHNWV